VGDAGATSHVSPPSRTPLPQTAPQSLSLVALHPGAQHPSPLTHAVMAVSRHVTLHAPLDPERTSVVHALPSSQVTLAQVGDPGATSQVSPASTRPLPQPGQSTSLVGPHPVGQDPSAVPQARATVVQRYVHALTEPDEVRTLSASDTHARIAVVQTPGGSQVSPASMRPLPQPGQSTSVDGPQATLVGQKPSAPPHERWRRVHTNVQAAALPDGVTTVLASLTQAFCVVVQALVGSQVSPDSRTPLPQDGAQSLSLRALQPAGQHPSLLAHAVCNPESTHCTSHVSGEPCGACN
jgi:hypothetical protein